MNLEPAESTDLQACETVIARGLANFKLVGNALMRIRDNNLYRATHENFGAYCQEKWGLSNRHCNRLIQSAQIVGLLPLKAEPLGPMGPIPEPTSERSIRPLTALEPSEQPAAYARAVELAEGKAPTAKQVQAAVDEIKPRDTKNDFANALGFKSTEAAVEAVEESEKPKSKGMTAARAAVKALDIIPLNDPERKEAFEYVIGWIENQ